MYIDIAGDRRKKQCGHKRILTLYTLGKLILLDHPERDGNRYQKADYFLFCVVTGYQYTDIIMDIVYVRRHYCQ